MTSHSTYRRSRSARGVTLIEVIVVIAIFASIAALGLLMSMDTFRGTIYRSEEATIVSLLQKARSRAMANMYQNQWSVCYISPNYIVAKGPVCDSAHAYDTLPANAGVASASSFPSTFATVAFTQLSGDVSTDISIPVVQDGRSTTIKVNRAGRIQW